MRDNEKRDADTRLMLQITVDDIKVGKNRLWTSTYYMLSLYAGLIAFSKLFSFFFADDWIIDFLLNFGFIISFFAIYHIVESHASIARYRKRLNKVVDMLHEEVRDLYVVMSKSKYTSFHRYSISLTFPFIILIIAAYFLVIINVFKTNIDWQWVIYRLLALVLFGIVIYLLFWVLHLKKQPLTDGRFFKCPRIC